MYILDFNFFMIRKLALLLFSLFLFLSCSVKKRFYLGKEEYPFRSDIKLLFKDRTSNYYYYKKYRRKYNSYIDSLRNAYPNDTLFLAEIVNTADCFCPPDEIIISVNGKYYYKRDETFLKNLHFKPIHESHERNQLYKLKQIIKSDINWIGNFKSYDICEWCSGISDETFTLILPNNKVITKRVKQLEIEEELRWNFEQDSILKTEKYP